jgi:hypothetical protein
VVTRIGGRKPRPPARRFFIRWLNVRPNAPSLTRCRWDQKRIDLYGIVNGVKGIN